MRFCNKKQQLRGIFNTFTENQKLKFSISLALS